MRQIIRLIIRDWKTPKHSSDRSKDDTHEVKRKILDAIKGQFEKKVGKNPDIDIDKRTKKIVLRGTKAGPFKGKEFDTSLNADDFFISVYIVISNNDEETLNEINNSEINKFYVIPADETIICNLINYIYSEHTDGNTLIEIII